MSNFETALTKLEKKVDQVNSTASGTNIVPTITNAQNTSDQVAIHAHSAEVFAGNTK